MRGVVGERGELPPHEADRFRIVERRLRPGDRARDRGRFIGQDQYVTQVERRRARDREPRLEEPRSDDAVDIYGIAAGRVDARGCRERVEHDGVLRARFLAPWLDEALA